jgi:hypothetical protein
MPKAKTGQMTYAIPNAFAQFRADPPDLTAIVFASPRASGTTPGS